MKIKNFTIQTIFNDSRFKELFFSDAGEMTASSENMASSPFARNFLRKTHYDNINSSEAPTQDDK